MVDRADVYEYIHVHDLQHACQSGRHQVGWDGAIHLFAMIRLENGRTLPVDLRRQQNLQDGHLQEGKKVVLPGRMIPIGNPRTLAVHIRWRRQAALVAGQLPDPHVII